MTTYSINCLLTLQLIVYDVVTKAVDQIPCLAGQRENVNVDEPGINAISINPSRCLIATAGKNNNELGIYKLPTLDPMYIGEVSGMSDITNISWYAVSSWNINS